MLTKYKHYMHYDIFYSNNIQANYLAISMYFFMCLKWDALRLLFLDIVYNGCAVIKM